VMPFLVLLKRRTNIGATTISKNMGGRPSGFTQKSWFQVKRDVNDGFIYGSWVKPFRVSRGGYKRRYSV